MTQAILLQIQFFALMVCTQGRLWIGAALILRGVILLHTTNSLPAFAPHAQLSEKHLVYKSVQVLSFFGSHDETQDEHHFGLSAHCDTCKSKFNFKSA